jgi:hypothetical protein
MGRKSKTTLAQIVNRTKVDTKRVVPSQASTIHNVPTWGFEWLDYHGEYCLKKADEQEARAITRFLAEYGRKKWSDIDRDSSHHHISKGSLSKDVEKYLQKINKTDFADDLFSFRVTSENRLIGLRLDCKFEALFWDPRHQICPSVKKHT